MEQSRTLMMVRIVLTGWGAERGMKPEARTRPQGTADTSGGPGGHFGLPAPVGVPRAAQRVGREKGGGEDDTPRNYWGTQKSWGTPKDEGNPNPCPEWGGTWNLLWNRTREVGGKPHNERVPQNMCVRIRANPQNFRGGGNGGGASIWGWNEGTPK